MHKDRKQIDEGYKPYINEKGYQPTKPQNIPTGDPKTQGGYQPTTGQGDNQSNSPRPPKDE
jgi:hypothetical protein